MRHIPFLIKFLLVTIVFTLYLGLMCLHFSLIDTLRRIELFHALFIGCKIDAHYFFSLMNTIIQYRQIV